MRVLKPRATCKRLNRKNGNKNWTVLPLEKVNTSRPFETTGVDFDSPLYVKPQAGHKER